MQEERTRYYFIDGIRGIAIINMTLFHFLYDVYIVYAKCPTWYNLPAIHIWQQMICWTFIFVSGAVLLMLPLEKTLKEIPAVCGMAISFLLFLLCKQIQSGMIGVPGLLEIQVPDLLYDIRILTPFGFPYKGFYSSDYFPLFPWIFLYLCGFYFNQIFMKHISWQKYARCKIPCLSAIGSRTIWIYLLHQPLSMLICFLTFH